MRASEIRAAFLDYFEEKNHERVRSSSLIPHNDPTLFFVNAGMVQFKDVFTGNETRNVPRATTSQKCLRVSGKHNDLENVGRTPRHHTFFEMLGNFSFGDYFKEDAIAYAWEFLTERVGLDPERLWVTVFTEDDEAHAIWRDKVGVPDARIQRLGVKDNFWSMGDTGPCGPCSEIHWDKGEGHGPPGGPATESDRYMEIWNLVFMQYEQHDDGSRTDLPRPSIDTGMGLERIAAVKQNVSSNYDIDLFQGIIQRAAAIAGVTYGDDDDTDTALRVIADHSRATAFLVADGVMPSNEGRGYVLRRIMRRAIRFAVKLDIDDLFFHHTVDQVIADMSDVFTELDERRAFILEVVRAEESRFRKTLHRGMARLDAEIAASGDRISGDVAFQLHDTFGFPIDLTRLICSENGVGIDEARFDELLEAQRQMGKANWKGSGEEAIGALWHELAEEHGATTFRGYDRDVDVGTVLALVKKTGDDSALVDHLDAGEAGIVLLDQTPFYAESGGQVGDSGTVGAFTVSDTTKASGLHLHHGTATGTIRVGDAVQADVDGDRRDHTRRNHTATHLLHAALRDVLGTHVTQKGSLVGPFRLRFDFSHHKPVEVDELRAIEDQVNAEVLRNTGIETTLKNLEEAIEAGAMALFGEKYDDDVRVVEVPGYSVELCGGTHVRATGDIGLFRITSESGIAAGVRRIEAQTGHGAIGVVREQADTLDAVAAQLKTNPDQLVEGIARLQEDRKRLEKELAALQREMAKEAAGALLTEAREVDGIKVLAVEFDGDLKEQADRLRDQLGSAVVVLAARRGAKAQLVAAATKDIAGKRVHAGKLIKEIAPLVGGGGGGRPDLAQAGGKNPDGIPAALQRAYTWVEETLG